MIAEQGDTLSRPVGCWKSGFSALGAARAALWIPFRFLGTASITGIRLMGTVPPRPRGRAGYLRPSGPPSG